MQSDQIQKLITPVIDKEISEISQIEGRGLVNQVFKITTESRKYILRIDPDENKTTRFEKEAWCYRSASEVGIPSPEVIGVDKTVEENPFILISYIEGIDGDLANAKDKPKIWRTLGDYARKTHGIKVAGFGENMISDGVFGDSWEEFIDYNIKSLIPDDTLIARGVISKIESELLQRIFIELKEKQFNFGLVHNDLSLKNTRIDASGKVYLIDWGSALVDIIPHTEFAEILNSSLDEDSNEFGMFLQGYGMSRDELPSISKEIIQLNLLKRINKIRWAIDRKPEVVDKKVSKFREALKQLSL